MRNIKSIFQTISYRASNYNLFIPDENDYDEEPKDPTIDLKHQKYITRLYILLLLLCMYILFYTTIMKPQSRTIIITNIDVNKFEKLYSEHGDRLSCPCSTISKSYETFVSNKIEFHPVCSSFFIIQQWIDGLYLSNRSLYGTGDFRTTAASQFQLISSLCSFSHNMIMKNKLDLNNNQFVSVYLLTELKVQSFQSSLSTRIISFINYFRILTQTNNFISYLNTNAAMLYNKINGIGIYMFSYGFIRYSTGTDAGVSCVMAHSISKTTFYSSTDWYSYFSREQLKWTAPGEDSKIVNGFFTGCMPFEALLFSTLDCLYEIDCLQFLNDNFPSLNHCI